MRNTNNRRRALGIRVKLPVTEHATNKSCSFVLLYIEVHQTVTCVAQVPFIEPLIEREEGHSTALQ